MTDLVERLRMPIRITHFYTGITDEHYDPVRAEAATALEAKDKELAALRERVNNLVVDRDTLALWAKKEEARAETAERELDTMNNNHRVMAKLLADTGRERDEAREALKRISDWEDVDRVMREEKP